MSDGETKKKDKPFYGSTVVNGNIRFTSASQINQFDDQHEGCPTKWWLERVGKKKLVRPDYLKKGVDLAGLTETYLTTGQMVLPPVLQPAIKFFPNPRNDRGELDLICEEPLGDIGAAIALRDRILANPTARNRAEAEAELDRLAGLTICGIPFDGAADWVHRRGTFKDKDGALRLEARGIKVVSVGDLKSTTQIRSHVTRTGEVKQGWAQTDSEVVKDPQMVTYGKHRLKVYKDATHARLEKVYAQKKSFEADIRGGIVTRQFVDDQFGELETRLVGEMVQTAKATKAEDVRPALANCDSYSHVIPCGAPGCGRNCDPGKIQHKGEIKDCPSCKGKGKTQKGCGHRYYCPHFGKNDAVIPMYSPPSIDISGTQGAKTMSLFDKLATQSAVTPPAPSVTATAAPPPPAPAAPSAPASDAEFRARVEAEKARLLAEADGLVVAQTPVAAPPPPPPAPVAPAAPATPVSVVMCTVGDDYLVDCEDGKPHQRMKLESIGGGKWTFIDRIGMRVVLGVKDSVTPVQQVLPHTDAPRDPLSVRPPDAPRAAWIDEAAPLSPAAIAEIPDPVLKEVAEEHRRQHELREAETAKNAPATEGGGNCEYGGQQHVLDAKSALAGLVKCPKCGNEKKLTREQKKVAKETGSFEFPGHRRPKVVKDAETPAAAPAPPVQAAPPPPPVPAAPMAIVIPSATVSVPPPPPPPPAPSAPEPQIVSGTPSDNNATKLTVLTADEVRVLGELFRGKCGVPVGFLAPSVQDLLRRLGLAE